MLPVHGFLGRRHSMEPLPQTVAECGAESAENRSTAHRRRRRPPESVGQFPVREAGAAGRRYWSATVISLQSWCISGRWAGAGCVECAVFQPPQWAWNSTLGVEFDSFFNTDDKLLDCSALTCSSWVSSCITWSHPCWRVGLVRKGAIQDRVRLPETGMPRRTGIGMAKRSAPICRFTNGSHAGRLKGIFPAGKS
jgi:hypothetical protein